MIAKPLPATSTTAIAINKGFSNTAPMQNEHSRLASPANESGHFVHRPEPLHRNLGAHIGDVCGVDFPEHRRLNYRGRDGVDGDAAFGELLAQRLIISEAVVYFGSLYVVLRAGRGFTVSRHTTELRPGTILGREWNGRSATFDRRIAALDHSREAVSIASACLARSFPASLQIGPDFARVRAKPWVSVIDQLDFRGRFAAVVSALQIPVSWHKWRHSYRRSAMLTDY